MPRFRFISFAVAACVAAIGLWALRSRPVADIDTAPAKVESLNVWRVREPAVAVAGRPAANRRQPWMREVSAVLPVAAPVGLRLEKGARLSLPLPDGRMLGGVVRLVRSQAGGGEVAGGRLDDGGSFTLGHRAGQWTGAVLPKDGPTVYRVFQDNDGGAALAAVSRESVLCASLPRGPRATRADGAAGADEASSNGSVRLAAASAAMTEASSEEVPLLNSRPDALPVIYLDFDGETVTEPFWNGGETIEAAHSGLSAEDMAAIWRRVAEDYAPFNINVSTDPARYAAARPMQRMRCIITSTAWYGDDVGGVAALMSWPHAGIPLEYYAGQIPQAEDVPCWAFTFADDVSPYPAENIALAVSHEVGHTFGLFHDGATDETGEYVDEYYDGHGYGVTSWGPIMGAPYGRALIQWSEGGYMGQMFGVNAEGDILVGDGFANNDEDDVAIIASIVNHVGFAPERRAANLAEAGRLAVAGDGMTVDHMGLVEVGGAESWLLVALGAGPVELQLVAPHGSSGPDAVDEDATNVDGALTLTDLAGNILATADDPLGRFAALAVNVPTAGVYVLRVASVGEGDPADGGYFAYGSVGRFRVRGTVVAANSVAPVIGGAARVEGRVGDAMDYRIEAAGMALTFSAADLPPGLVVGPEGRITGTPTQPGIFQVEVEASNLSGASARTVTFAVATDDLAEALDAPGLVFSTGGDRPWRGVAEADSPTGGSAARSGEVLDGYQQSWIETGLHGPGRLRWRWKVSSEFEYDYYRALLDGVVVAEISGDTPWAQMEIEVPAGAHMMRWSYDKDPFFSDFQDAAWLDDVRWARGFELWVEAATLAEAAAGAEADPDGDGVVNLLEYAFNRAPASPDGLGNAVRVAPALEPEAAGALEVEFDLPSGRDDLRYTVEVSGDLITWDAGHRYGPGIENIGELPTIEIARVVLEGGGGERVRVRDGGSLDGAGDAGGSRRFMRIRVER